MSGLRVCGLDLGSSSLYLIVKYSGEEIRGNLTSSDPHSSVPVAFLLLQIG